MIFAAWESAVIYTPSVLDVQDIQDVVRLMFVEIRQWNSMGPPNNNDRQRHELKCILGASLISQKDLMV